MAMKHTHTAMKLHLPALWVTLWVTLTAGCSKSDGDKPKAQRDDAVPVSVAKVEVVPLDRTLPVVGTLFAKDEATIGAQVEG